VFALAGVVVFIVLAAALAARDAIEATLLQRAFATAIGGDATIAALRYDGGARILDNLHLRTGDGSLDVTAEHVMLADRGDTLDVTAAGVRVTVAANRVPRRRARPARSTRRCARQRSRAAARPRCGRRYRAHHRERAARGGLAGIDATVRRDGNASHYEARLSIADRGGAYPVTAAGTVDARGHLTATWSAPAIPLASLVNLLPLGGLVLRDGIARDVSLTQSGATSRLTMNLSGVAGTLDDHELRGLTGPLVLNEDGMGTSGSAGRWIRRSR